MSALSYSRLLSSAVRTIWATSPAIGAFATCLFAKIAVRGLLGEFISTELDGPSW
ncbi:hypothetical protein [Promicromonospora kroppenstedtii]|uniref:hypothetical protein n=1 Tax=Promicromonospora kroppenstedtii TaxID=440482 RepID=UPI0004B2C52D|nr:hypothetical protein [Promicromonospora kroppenstedtii]